MKIGINFLNDNNNTVIFDTCTSSCCDLCKCNKNSTNCRLNKNVKSSAIFDLNDQNDLQELQKLGWK
jgi:hypothetical protein